MATVPENPEMAAVRNDLAARIGAIELRLGRFPTGEIVSELDAIRRRAAQHGLRPAVSVVHALESAIARGERGPLVSGWLHLLRDAVGCERSDPDSDAAFTAACWIRYDS